MIAKGFREPKRPEELLGLTGKESESVHLTAISLCRHDFHTIRI